MLILSLVHERNEIFILFQLKLLHWLLFIRQVNHYELKSVFFSCFTEVAQQWKVSRVRDFLHTLIVYCSRVIEQDLFHSLLLVKSE